MDLIPTIVPRRVPTHALEEANVIMECVSARLAIMELLAPIQHLQLLRFLLVGDISEFMKPRLNYIIVKVRAMNLRLRSF